jgi:hypothetical protein
LGLMGFMSWLGGIVMSELTEEEHRQAHVKLHVALDELFADYIAHHPNQSNFLDMRLGDFIMWSSEQTVKPTSL